MNEPAKCVEHVLSLIYVVLALSVSKVGLAHDEQQESKYATALISSDQPCRSSLPLAG